MAWRTMLDEFNETGVVPEPFAVVERGADVPHVRCACRRVVAIDMMVDTDAGYICDGCLSAMRRKRGLGRREFVDMIGGPRDDSPKPTRPYAGGRKALDIAIVLLIACAACTSPAGPGVEQVDIPPIEDTDWMKNVSAG